MKKSLLAIASLVLILGEGWQWFAATQNRKNLITEASLFQSESLHLEKSPKALNTRADNYLQAIKEIKNRKFVAEDFLEELYQRWFDQSQPRMLMLRTFSLNALDEYELRELKNYLEKNTLRQYGPPLLINQIDTLLHETEKTHIAEELPSLLNQGVPTKQIRKMWREAIRQNPEESLVWYQKAIADGSLEQSGLRANPLKLFTKTLANTLGKKQPNQVRTILENLPKYPWVLTLKESYKSE